ncbi:MAG: zinc dependent phospholipase C family protein, partial [Bacteroidota bacterium]
MIKRIQLIVLLFTLSTPTARGWGFWAHRQINRHAVFTLPPAMLTFYKYHIQLITEHAVDPDKRRYIVEGEAAKHYIDLDHYGEAALYSMPRYWHQALEMYPEAVLQAHGILPWHIYRMKHRLTKAFENKDVAKILKLSADIGHYIADANVPLHTTENYNGQLTGQEGIHGLWETRLPMLFFEDYDLFVGKAAYISKPLQRIWEAIITAHKGVEPVLRLEKQLSQSFPSTRKYSFEQHGNTLHKVYAFAYAQAYHNALEGQVERQLRAAIKMVGDFWLTCWIDAGQPDLAALMDLSLQETLLQEPVLQPHQKKLRVRCCG